MGCKDRNNYFKMNPYILKFTVALPKLDVWVSGAYKGKMKGGSIHYEKRTPDCGATE